MAHPHPEIPKVPPPGRGEFNEPRQPEVRRFVEEKKLVQKILRLSNTLENERFHKNHRGVHIKVQFKKDNGIEC